MSKNMISITVFLLIFAINTSHANSTESDKRLFFNPIKAAEYQIELFLTITKNLVSKQLTILNEFQEKIEKLAHETIKTSSVVMDAVVGKSVRHIRDLTQYAIDKGINVTECSILNLDKLRVLRRHLIVGEIQCASGQVGQFYEIVDGATKNFTDDLATIFTLPKKLQKCLITITPISCVTKIVNDVTNLQKIIPKQILGTMLDVTKYLNGFQQRVHKCQFNEFRNAVVGMRHIIDNLVECILHSTSVTIDEIIIPAELLPSDSEYDDLFPE